MYNKYIKRILDFLCSFIAILVILPIFLVLIILGSIIMKGNPFFVQERPGKNSKIFKLIKFRTMDNRRDKEGNLLPDEVRLNGYGKFLRKTSLDELPELFNIVKGDMAIVGPRPLLVKYLPRYDEEQMHRHDVRPGLTGYAQIYGKYNTSAEDKLKMDLMYIEKQSLLLDLQLIFLTIKIMFIPESTEGFEKQKITQGRE